MYQKLKPDRMIELVKVLEQGWGLWTLKGKCQRRKAILIHDANIDALAQKQAYQVLSPVLDRVVHGIAVEIVLLQAINATLLKLVENARNHLLLVDLICRVYRQNVHQILPFIVFLLHFFILRLLLYQGQEKLEFLLIKGVLHRLKIIVAFLNDQIRDSQLATVDRDPKCRPRGLFGLDFVV